MNYTSIIVRETSPDQWWVIGYLNENIQDCLKYFESEEDAREYA